MKSVILLIAMILIAGVAAVEETEANTEIKAETTETAAPAIASAAEESNEDTSVEDEDEEDDILEDADSTLESDDSEESEDAEDAEESKDSDNSDESEESDNVKSDESEESENNDEVEDSEEDEGNDEEDEDESDIEDEDADFWRRRRRRRRRFKASKVTVDNVWAHLQAAEKKCKIPQASGTRPYCRRMLNLRGCPHNLSYFDRLVAMRKHCWALAEVKAIFAIATSEPISNCKYVCKKGVLNRWPDNDWFNKKETKLRKRVMKIKTAVRRVIRRSRSRFTRSRSRSRRSRFTRSRSRSRRFGRFRGRVEDEEQDNEIKAQDLELSNSVVADEAQVTDKQWFNLIKEIDAHNAEIRAEKEQPTEEVKDNDQGGSGWWCCFGWC